MNVVALLTLLCVSASALGYSGPAPTPFQLQVADRAERGTIAHLVPRIHSHLAGLPRSAPSPACAAAYSRLFAQPVIDVRMAYGYADWVTIGRRDREAVHYQFNDQGIVPGQNTRVSLGYNGSNDQFIALSAWGALTRRCPTGSDVEACGFAANGRYLELEKRVAARDGSGRTSTVRVRLAYSSFSPFYDLNVGEFRANQTVQTQYAEDVFFGGLREADIVLYNGHARVGAGPDFAPPLIDVNTRHPRYDEYLRTRPGLSRMRQALQARRADGRPSPYLIGIFACDSNRRTFTDVLEEWAPDSRLAFSVGVTSANFEAEVAPVLALDAMLRQRCASEMTASLNLNRGNRTDIVLIEPKSTRR